MTKEQFDKQQWGKGDVIIYKGEKYYVTTVDFEERLVGFISAVNYFDELTGEPTIARCENVEML